MTDDIVLKQIKNTNDTLLAVQLLAELLEKTRVESNKGTDEIRKILLGDNTPEGKKKSIVGRLENLENQSKEIETHSRLIYGDPTDPKESGLLADVHANVRMVKAIQKLIWVVVGVIVPLIIGALIALTKLNP